MTAKEQSIGIIGPGMMGGNMALRLLENQYKVKALKHKSELNEIAEAGGTVVESISELSECDIVLLTLPGSTQVEEAIIGEGGLSAHLKEDALIVDMSTSFPASSLKIAEAMKQAGREYLEAPMTRGPAQARSGKLNLMIGGERKVFEKHEELFQLLAENIIYTGGHGSAFSVKLLNNFLGQLNMIGLAEVMTLAEKLGLDTQAMYDLITVSGGNSTVFQGVTPNLMQRKFPLDFKLKFVLKDLSYFCDLADEAGIKTPVANQVRSQYHQANEQGYGEDNFSSIFKYVEKELQES